ncbi:MAG: type II toxin-antitoxin system RelE/ParE family toxin [Calditrichaeota bacterium]|nr:MAG: type II toxin-antitoxin system RelE/ParE family toxin [Calditrichota bacterium]MBL1205705.1 type II toxin-antitoxin system RelE/ParE family toxin [Calditrichota bacterium]NOG45533.1 type II toxin-antitoxin system RelE/ParE family toxin [Calditrichota bacterium]
MKYKLIISPEAEQDIKEAFYWYEENRKGLGHDFLLQVNGGLKFIERSPKVFKEEYKGTRKHVIKRFPYKIIYIVQDNLINILAVIHGSRNPKYTSSRINSF